MCLFYAICPGVYFFPNWHFLPYMTMSLFFKDDIFAPSTVKPVVKAPQKSKKTPPSQETSTATDSSDIFDDPLNAVGGN